MPTIVENCPRCAANNMTFDVFADEHRSTSYGWQSHHEICVKCRRCYGFSIMAIDLHNSNLKHKFDDAGSITAMKGDLAPTFRLKRFLDVSDLKGAVTCPDSVPADIKDAFDEGAKCFSISCYNAAAAMFRLALDLASKPLLPSSDHPTHPQPTKQQRNFLKHRLDWLLEQGIIPASLADLVHGIREDGNDGAHDGTLTEVESNDLLDFAVLFLKRFFTEPAAIEEAKKLRIKRRGGTSGLGAAEPG